MTGNLLTYGFWLGAIGMTAGTAYPLYRYAIDRDNARYYAVLAAIPAIAAVAYATMALGVGSIRTGGHVVYIPRYVDWLLTTPLLVLFLAWLAEADRQQVVAAIVADIVVIGTGFAGAVLSGPGKWAAFGVGCVAYLGLLALLVWTIPRSASFDSQHVAAVFTKLRNLTVVLWSVYPVVWLLSVAGFGLLRPTSEVLVVAYLDLITKVGFVAIAVNGHDALSTLSGSVPDDTPESPSATAD